MIALRISYQFVPVGARECVTQDAPKRLALKPEGIFHVHIQLVHLELRDRADDLFEVAKLGNRATAHINLGTAILERRPVTHVDAKNPGLLPRRDDKLAQRLRAVEQSFAVLAGQHNAVRFDVENIALVADPFRAQVARGEHVPHARLSEPAHNDHRLALRRFRQTHDGKLLARDQPQFLLDLLGGKEVFMGDRGQQHDLQIRVHYKALRFCLKFARLWNQHGLLGRKG